MPSRVSLDVEIRGLEETRAKMEQMVVDLHGKPMLEAMRDATLIVQRSAREYAPVDTGRLRASIVPEVRMAGADVVGVVGTNVKYGPFMELGTRPHWPPLGALETWARRHGTTAFVVARAIARRGTKARRYLQKALQNNREAITRLLDRAVGRIVRK